MANVTQLGYLGLSVSDVDAWERFATETLGLQVHGRDADGAVFLRMDEYHHRFIVHPTGKDDVAQSSPKFSLHQCGMKTTHRMEHPDRVT